MEYYCNVRMFYHVYICIAWKVVERLWEAWEELRFSCEVEDRLSRFIRSHSLELQGYSVDTSEQ